MFETVWNLSREEDAEDTASCAHGRDRINLPEITNSFQHSLEESRRQGEKAFSKARVPPPWRCFLSSLHLRAVHLAFPFAFYRSFLRPPRKFPQFLSLLIHPPLGAFILLLSFKRRDAMLPGRNSPWSCSALKVKFKPHHWIHRSFSPPFSSRLRAALQLFLQVLRARSPLFLCTLLFSTCLSRSLIVITVSQAHR